ncbi:hypothetical protein [Alcaligenes faecalis]|uniref:Nmad2 family putative nucleotide modification protein n=1 Tax=Alcaligenes faecalis TaxID=511 RepID=UPI0034D44CB3
MGSPYGIARRPQNYSHQMPMNAMPRLYSYKLSRDFGFAPNPFHGICTLATCKPKIREGAQIGDLIVGCGSKSLKMEGRIIFAMRVTDKLSFQQYWVDPRFAAKKARFISSKAAAFGDNIYHLDRGRWKQEDSHHSFEGGRVNQANFNRDLNSKNVLLSDDFVYWGGLAPQIPNHLRHFDGDDLYPNVRDYRSRYSKAFVDEVAHWFTNLPERGNRGRPTCW